MSELCPHCQEPGEPSPVSGMLHCKNSHYFRVDGAPALPASDTTGMGWRAQKIRDRAELFSVVAGFSVVVSFFCFFAAIILGVTSGFPELTISAGVSALGAAFGFYFMAQVIHIRANTEK